MADAEVALPDRPILSVLAIDNMASDVDQEHLADILTEDLITDLSKFDSLDVIACNSTFAYRGQSIDVRLAGRELGAHLILEGSVRNALDAVRFAAQLIDARTGHHDQRRNVPLLPLASRRARHAFRSFWRPEYRVQRQWVRAD